MPADHLGHVGTIHIQRALPFAFVLDLAGLWVGERQSISTAGVAKLAAVGDLNHRRFPFHTASLRAKMLDHSFLTASFPLVVGAFGGS
jgi:hypothetical protein